MSTPQNSDWAQNAIIKIATDSLAEQRKSRYIKLIFRVLVVFLLSLMAFASCSKRSERSVSLTSLKPHTAVIEMHGAISGSQKANAADINRQLEKAFQSPNSKGVLLDINSPGGTPVQSEIVYNKIVELRAEYTDKPIIAVVSDTGASGAYYIAAAADSIYAMRSSLVGSIGVRLDSFGVEGLMEKLGVESRTITAGDHKGLLSPFSPVDQVAVDHLQSTLDEVHQQFIEAVKDGRGERLNASDDELFNGLVWSGDAALTLGLIDGIGDVETVATDVIGESELHFYKPDPDFLDMLRQDLGANISLAFKEQVNSWNFQ